MATRRRFLALGAALAVAGCAVPLHPVVGKGKPAAIASPLVPTGAAVVSDHGTGIIANNGGQIISEHGGGLVANNGGALIGKAKIPTGLVANNAGNLSSDAGGSIVSNDGSTLIANNAGNIIANHGGGYALLNVDEKPLEGFAVTIVDAAGKQVLDASGQPYRTTTAADGSYKFAATPRGQHLVVRVELPSAVGPMLAFLPDAAPGTARQADVSAASTLVMGYVLDKFLQGATDPDASLQKLPASVEATTRAKAAAAFGAAPELKSFRPEALVPKVDALQQANPDFAQQVEIVRKLLVLGLSDVGDGQPATTVALSIPKWVAPYTDGNLLIAERDGHRVRLLNLQTGIISTFAGKAGATAMGDGGPATDAFIDRPVAVAATSTGDVYICDFGHHALRKVDAKTHTIATVAGNGKEGDGQTSVDGKQGKSVSLKFPLTLVVDAKDRPIFKSEDGILRVEPDGTLKLLATEDGEMPGALTRGPDGTIYAYDYTSGMIYKLAGDTWRTTDNPMLPAADGARLCVGPDGTFYLSDDDKVHALAPGGSWKDLPISTNHGWLEGVGAYADGLALSDGQFNRVWKVPFAGGAAVPLAGLDATNADALSADKLSLNRPTAVVPNGPGHLLVADGLNGVVWERRPDGLFYRFAGGPPAKGTDTDLGDGGPARDAKLLKVAGVAHLKDGTVLISEADPPTLNVRQVTPDGTISTLTLPDGLAAPAVIVEQADGSRLCSDYLTKQILVWKGDTATPAVSTDDIKQPGGIAVAPDGSFYCTDVKGCAIWHVVGGKPTLVAGGNGEGNTGDGGPALAAQVAEPLGIALAANGDLYIADTRNDRVRRIRKGSTAIEPVTGPGGIAFTGDSADDSLKEPVGMTFDINGDLYIADSGHNQIKRIEAAKLK